MQIKTTMKYHYTPISRAKTYKQTKTWIISSADKQVKKLELSYFAGEWYSHSGKQFGNFFFAWVKWLYYRKPRLQRT